MQVILWDPISVSLLPSVLSSQSWAWCPGTKGWNLYVHFKPFSHENHQQKNIYHLPSKVVAPKKQHVPSIKTIINCHTKPQGLQAFSECPQQMGMEGLQPTTRFCTRHSTLTRARATNFRRCNSWNLVGLNDYRPPSNQWDWYIYLGGGWTNPSEKYLSNWESSPK